MTKKTCSESTEVFFYLISVDICPHPDFNLISSTLIPLKVISAFGNLDLPFVSLLKVREVKSIPTHDLPVLQVDYPTVRFPVSLSVLLVLL